MPGMGCNSPAELVAVVALVALVPNVAQAPLKKGLFMNGGAPAAHASLLANCLPLPRGRDSAV